MADRPSVFSIHTPPHLLARLKVWTIEMKASGRGIEYLAALKELNHRLETDPDRWGDPLRQYHYMRGLEARGMVPGWLLVWYGVATDARDVRVRDILPAPGSPLTV
jgi:hypothetical protein